MLTAVKNNFKNMFLSITIGLVSLLLVSSMFIQFRAVNESQESNLEGLRSDELKTQIATYKSRY